MGKRRMVKNRQKAELDINAPLLHENHKRPTTRREFLGQGFVTGSAMIMAPTMLNMMLAKQTYAADKLVDCGIGGTGSADKKIPFMCFDLGGGASMTGSNVLVGGPGGQEDFISTGGYNKLGIPGDQIPSLPGMIDRQLGLAFHTDSAFLRGILSKTSVTTRANINGAVIPARSDNDTSTNPHNPMYGIATAGANGKLVDLIGTRNSDSGGRSVAPDSMIDLTKRPTRVSSPTDATGLVDTGDLGTMMPNPVEAGAVMNAIQEISFARIKKSETLDGLNKDEPFPLLNATQPTKSLSLEEQVDCAYHKTANTVTEFGDIDAFDPEADKHIVNANATVPPTVFTNLNDPAEVTVGLPDTPADTPSSGATDDTTPIFTTDEMNSGTFSRTASVMKLVVNEMAGAGTIELGGYDYHNGTRSSGERRDFNAGQAMGAALEYAARKNKRLMIYCFTDGSLASNGRIDDTPDGRGKGEWTGDNSSTSAAFFLVYNPGGRPVLMDDGTPGSQDRHQQLGHFRTSASVETTATTPGANSVNQLVEMLLLNYMALNGEQNLFATDDYFPNHNLGADLDKLTAFEPLA